VTELRQLQIQVRMLAARVATLEAAQTRKPRRAAAPRPDEAVVVAREKLWARYIELEMRFGHGRVKLTKASFTTRWQLSHSEFCRWLSPHGRGIPAGSIPDARFHRALHAAIRELDERGDIRVPPAVRQRVLEAPGVQ
jgi:hypothetical protein